MEKKWFNMNIKEVSEKLETDIKKGLDNDSVSQRFEKYGYNELKAKKKKSIFAKF